MGMQWEAEADERVQKILTDHAMELSEEAERIARRLKAGAVSAAYVEEAALTIRIRRPSGAWPDLLLAVGIGMLGIAGGVLAVILTAPPGAHLKLDWVGPASIAVACAGCLIAGIAGTLKVRAS
jgi:hypothetical protein